jgi:hypothetical protein
VRLARIAPGLAERSTLAEQVPAAVEFDLDSPQPLLISLELFGVRAVRLFAAAKLVLLTYQALDS